MVIAIIGILVALLLPAVQAAREAARRTKCVNNLKNITLGMLNHESTYGNLPSSGWAGNWTGDPDRGAGATQPGSWLYSILPFIEETPIYEMGSGLTGAARFAKLAERDATPIDVLNCPSRREGGPYAASNTAKSGDGTGGVGQYVQRVGARADYAVSVGDETQYDGNCIGLCPSDYKKTSYDPKDFPPKAAKFTGISYCGAAVKLRQITDGLSKTIALGERWVPEEIYADGENWVADDWGMYAGFQDDMAKSTYYNGRNPTHRPRGDFESLEAVQTELGTFGDRTREFFGGPHTGGCMFSMCDGSVSLLNYDVDVETFRQMGARADGGQIKEFARTRN
ncbi:DUF1559 family PulG-like putative transporter [Posidoniimonas polymericola]|uniref:DUF1559 family PulG-like putative transporter n=1 Tax=Posidoniimonas polymericola TaxID=2528002 RepID=UPI0018D37221